MAQGFQNVELTDALKDSLPRLMNNDEAAISCNAGTSFPTENTKEGMLCFRTDENKLYQLRGEQWIQLAEGGSINELLKGYLKLTGGSLSGHLNMLNGSDIWLKDQNDAPAGVIFQTLTDEYREVGITSKEAVEPYTNGSNITLTASDSPKHPSSFRINAKQGTTQKTLKGDVNGNLTWDGKKLGVDATETQSGTVLLASAVEVKAGTVSNKVVTPSGLKQFYDVGQLGTVRALGNGVDLNTLKTNGRYWVNQTGQENGPTGTGGYIEVSTVREDGTAGIIQKFIAAAGGNTNAYYRITTDNGENWSVWSQARLASTAQTGVVQLASSEEVSAGTVANKAVTPKALKEAGIGEVDLSGYLPLTGGTIDGEVTVNGSWYVKFNTNKGNQVGVISHWEDDQNVGFGMECFDGETYGPMLLLRSKNSPILPSTFSFGARGGGVEKWFIGDTNGNLTWDGKRVLTEGDGGGAYLPLTGGTVTGATTFTGTLKSGSSGNLDLSTKLIKGVSISGKNITFTFNDGTTQRITTQDTVTTNTSNWTISKGTNGWARDNSTGLIIQWIETATLSSSTALSFTLTFPRSFTSSTSYLVFATDTGSACASFGAWRSTYSSCTIWRKDKGWFPALLAIGY